MLCTDGDGDLVRDILPVRNDGVDAGQRASDGVPAALPGPWRRLRGRLDVLVRDNPKIFFEKKEIPEFPKGGNPLVLCSDFVSLCAHRFAYVTLAADEIVAVTNALRFSYDDGRTVLRWVVGNDVDPAVWVTVFIIIVTLINTLPVKVRLTFDNRYNCARANSLIREDRSISESWNISLAASS
jgi:hypothetical protein